MVSKLDRIYEFYEEVEEKYKDKIKKTMFPIRKVDNCIRILPFLNNSGGFFMGLIRKNEVLFLLLFILLKKGI